MFSFFQAEDGIRDGTVTGVQTCALPILSAPTIKKEDIVATEKGTASLKPAKGPVALLIGTRKGAFILRGDRARRTWKLSHPQFLGQIVHHVVLDPRDRRTMLMAARTG